MEEIVVARSSTGPAKVLAFVCVGIVMVRGWTVWLPLRALLFLGTLWAAHTLLNRLERMKLSVTPEVVHVVNFNSKYELDLRSVRIDDESNPDAWPQDDIIDTASLASNVAGSKRARMLCLTDDSGVKAQVGVAPSYGTRLDEIAEELYIAVDRMREVTATNDDLPGGSSDDPSEDDSEESD